MTKKKRKKITPSSHDIEKEANVTPWFDYLDMGTLRMLPINDTILTKIAEELVSWVDNDPKALKLEQFFIKKKITDTTFTAWCKRHDLLREARDYARMIIGVRRELGVVNKKYEPTFVRFTMPFYDKNWKDIEEWRASLKSKIEHDKENRSITVIIPPAKPAPEESTEGSDHEKNTN